MLVHSGTGRLVLIVEEAQAFSSSGGDIYLSFYSKKPSEVLQETGTLATRVLFTLEEDISLYPVEALRREWFPHKFYISPIQGASLASIFPSGRIPFRGMMNMLNLTNVIPAAQACRG